MRYLDIDMLSPPGEKPEKDLFALIIPFMMQLESCNGYYYYNDKKLHNFLHSYNELYLTEKKKIRREILEIVICRISSSSYRYTLKSPNFDFINSFISFHERLSPKSHNEPTIKSRILSKIISIVCFIIPAAMRDSARDQYDDRYEFNCAAYGKKRALSYLFSDLANTCSGLIREYAISALNHLLEILNNFFN